MPDPEITISSEHKYKGKRISVRLEHVRLSDGTESTRDIVDHPNAVVILAIDDNHNVLFVRQYRKAPEIELLELPAGVMDPEETDPLKSAQRELREETGYAAGELIPLGSFYSAPGTMTELLYCFLTSRTTHYLRMRMNELSLSECRLRRRSILLAQGDSRTRKR